jgi:hypothetical protein
MLTPILSDSAVAIIITRDLVKHELTKHIGVDAHFMWSHVRDGVVALEYVSSELQLVYFFMKARTRAHHQFYLSKLSVVDPPWVWWVLDMCYLFLLCMYIFGSLPLRWVQVLFITNTWTYYNRNAFKIIVFYLITWCMALSHYRSLGGECITCNFAENQKHAYGHFLSWLSIQKLTKQSSFF